MSYIIRRSLATASDAAIASTSSTSASKSPSLRSLNPDRTHRQALSASRATSAPLAVRQRRAQFPDAPQYKRKTTPEQEKRFQQTRGELAKDASEEERKAWKARESEDREAFLRGQDQWRSRIRGYQQVLQMPQKNLDGEEAGDGQQPKLSTPGQLHQYEHGVIPPPSSLSAQRIYLPNVQIRLMRNHTPVDQPYDTSIATFRIPPSMTKNDLRSYLYAVYGLAVTFIHTDNYIAPVARTPLDGQHKRVMGSSKTYKRAVVGLLEPFHYPDDMDELNAIIACESGPDMEEVELRREMAKLGKESRERWLNAQFMVDLQDAGKKTQMMKLSKGSGWRSLTHDNAGITVRAIMKKRKEEEQAIANAVKEMDREMTDVSAQ